MAMTMLVVEDDQDLRENLEKSFRRRDFKVFTAASVAEGTRLVRERHLDIVLLDMRLPDGSGVQVLHEVTNSDGDVPVIITTAFPETRTAVRAMREGAADYIIKPYDLEELHLIVERAIESRSLRRKVRRLEREQRGHHDLNDILGHSAPIQRLRQQIEQVAQTDTPVLIVGETGTGKELVTDSIHQLSSRSAKPLVKVNCSAFSEHLLESEIFGHVKGAFTDARDSRPGLFELADGGTLFLDEIAEMKPGLQTKLLRVVEGQSFRRVGGRQEIHADVRVIAATHRDLRARIGSGDFREDLFYRLNVFQIAPPPLRERGDDVTLLARRFIEQFAKAMGKGPLSLSGEAEQILSAYPWPGNVRELRNVMERATILCDQPQVTAHHLPAELQAAAFVRREGIASGRDMPSLADIEQQYVAHVAHAVGGNLSEAARVLGITRNTLKAKLRAPE